MPETSCGPLVRHHAAGRLADSTRSWCERRDLNSHAFRQRVLKPPRLPIPPRSQRSGAPLFHAPQPDVEGDRRSPPTTCEAPVESYNRLAPAPGVEPGPAASKATSAPSGHGIEMVAAVGVEPTESPRSERGAFASLATRLYSILVVVAGLEPAKTWANWFTASLLSRLHTLPNGRPRGSRTLTSCDTSSSGLRVCQFRQRPVTLTTRDGLKFPARFFHWSALPDLNRDALRHLRLKQARLPFRQGRLEEAARIERATPCGAAAFKAV